MVKIWEWFDNLVDRGADIIATPVSSLTDWFENNISSKLSLGIIDTLETLEDEAFQFTNPIIEKFVEMDSLSEDWKQYFKNLQVKKAPIQLAMIVPLAAGALISLASGVFAGLRAQIEQESLKWFKPSLLSPGDAILAMWRGELTREQVYDELAQQGYEKERVDLLIRVQEYIAGPQDLIRFTVRDVFREDVVSEYGYDEGFDEMLQELSPYLQKIGMSEEVMKNYWRAHWDLPSLTSAFEMFHRGYITEEDIKNLLRINDMAPYFIDNLVKIAYTPYTRVDIRRMYGAGVLNRAQVKKAYKDLGYDDEKAENLTKFTEISTKPAEKDLSKTEILTLYNAGEIQEAQAVKEFQKIGYDSEESKALIELEKVKVERDYKNREKKIISNQYYYNQISREEAVRQLNSLNVTERERETVLKEVDARIRDKHRSPTKSDLETWLKAGLISEPEFRAEMSNLGYADKYIDLYILELVQAG